MSVSCYNWVLKLNLAHGRGFLLMQIFLRSPYHKALGNLRALLCMPTSKVSLEFLQFGGRMFCFQHIIRVV